MLEINEQLGQSTKTYHDHEMAGEGNIVDEVFERQRDLLVAHAQVMQDCTMEMKSGLLRMGKTISNAINAIANEMERNRLLEEFFGLQDRIEHYEDILKADKIREIWSHSLPILPYKELAFSEKVWLSVVFNDKKIINQIGEIAISNAMPLIDTIKELLNDIELRTESKEDYFIDIFYGQCEKRLTIKYDCLDYFEKDFDYDGRYCCFCSKIKREKVSEFWDDYFINFESAAFRYYNCTKLEKRLEIRQYIIQWEQIDVKVKSIMLLKRLRKVYCEMDNEVRKMKQN